jgi:hypothetical protein
MSSTNGNGKSHSGGPERKRKPCCSFCRRPQAGRLIKGAGAVFICGACLEQAQAILGPEKVQEDWTQDWTPWEKEQLGKFDSLLREAGRRRLILEMAQRALVYNLRIQSGKEVCLAAKGLLVEEARTHLALRRAVNTPALIDALDEVIQYVTRLEEHIKLQVPGAAEL